MSFGRIKAEDQLIFLNSGQVLGIQDYSISDSLGASTLKYIGQGYKSLNQIVNSPQYSDLSLNALLIDSDKFIIQTGAQPLNCFILKNQTDTSNPYILTSGYLTNYTAKFTPNQIPQIASNFRFYSNAGNINTSTLDSWSSYQLNTIIANPNTGFNQQIGNTNYINLTLNEYNTNRVQDFSFSLDYNRLPIYNVGSRSPKRVDLVYPINVGCNISFEVDKDFVSITLQDFPTNKTKQNISVDVYSNKSQTRMATYSFLNATLISEKSSLNVDGNLVINRGYVGQIFRYNRQDYVNIIDFGFVANSIDYYIDWGSVALPFVSGLDFGTV